METKICSKCNQEKEMNAFCTDNSRPDKKKTWCRQCSDKNTARWKQQNTKRVIEYHQSYNEALKEKRRQEKINNLLQEIKTNVEKQSSNYNEMVKKLSIINDSLKKNTIFELYRQI